MDTGTPPTAKPAPAHASTLWQDTREVFVFGVGFPHPRQLPDLQGRGSLVGPDPKTLRRFVPHH